MTRKEAKLLLNSVLRDLRSINECISDSDFYDSYCDAYRKIALIKVKL